MEFCFHSRWIRILGGGRSSIVSFASIMVGFFTLHNPPLALILSFTTHTTIWRSVVTRPMIVTSVLLFSSCFSFEVLPSVKQSSWIHTGSRRIKSFSLISADYFPGLAKSLGYKVTRDKSFRMKTGKSLQLHYPLKAPQRDTQHKTYNIVWLVAESLRADMIIPEIMPATWGFAKKSSWFQNHYSGGNGTRMGMFTMFYGLYGNYWFTFLDERRGPLIMDLLVEDNYQLNMFTSAKFTYPEFDKTIFARIPKDQLHESSSGSGWERDRKNISQMLDFFEHRILRGRS